MDNIGEIVKVIRSSGILLHISSLPGKYGIGDIGNSAFQWIDFLEKTGTTFWQILPTNPTGYGNSPYQGLSAFAGNPLFIDLKDLCALDLLNPADLDAALNFPVQKVNFEKTSAWKRALLEKAHKAYQSNTQPDLIVAYENFKKESVWVNDFALFMALREEFNLVGWSDWPQPLKMREPQAINAFKNLHANEIAFHTFLQFIFSRQWQKLKQYANARGISIIGDIPIFMGFDSADVWALPHLFQLDHNRQPLAVAGVPPDFFSETGQLWGNPLYEWKNHKDEDYAWWIRRISETLKTVDLVRLDHFRGFVAYFSIPAGSLTAEHGKWVAGPGADLFDAMQKQLGNLPFIAEDLGVITPDVIALREKYHFPGMRVLQFAFPDNSENEFLPHNYPVNCVAYTGTHDNDTSVGWYQHASKHEKSFCASYLGHHTKDIAHEMISAVWRSNAGIAIAPMQDFLRLRNWARMNLPATTQGNWRWRMKPEVIDDRLIDWLREINTTYNRSSSKKD